MLCANFRPLPDSLDSRRHRTVRQYACAIAESTNLSARPQYSSLPTSACASSWSFFTVSAIAAYRLLSTLQDRDQSPCIGATCLAAFSLMRTCWESRLEADKGVSICSTYIESPADFFCPSITGLLLPNLPGALERFFDWFQPRSISRGAPLLEPAESWPFLGEPTCSDPYRAKFSDR